MILVEPLGGNLVMLRHALKRRHAVPRDDVRSFFVVCRCRRLRDLR